MGELYNQLLSGGGGGNSSFAAAAKIFAQQTEDNMLSWVESICPEKKKEFENLTQEDLFGTKEFGSYSQYRHTSWEGCITNAMQEFANGLSFFYADGDLSGRAGQQILTALKYLRVIKNLDCT